MRHLFRVKRLIILCFNVILFIFYFTNRRNKSNVPLFSLQVHIPD